MKGKMSVRKTYSLTVNSEEEKQEIDTLVKRYVTEGKNITQAVVELARKHNARFKPKFTLVSELELLNIAKKRGLTVGKSSIVQYRRKGVLKDEKGPWYFQNSEHRVVYNLEKMLEFLERRSKRPKSRIIPKNAITTPQSARVIRKGTTE